MVKIKTLKNKNKNKKNLSGGTDSNRDLAMEKIENLYKRVTNYSLPKIYSSPKTLKNKINKYICKKQDIYGENDIDRDLAIKEIVKLYKNIAKFYEKNEDYYLDYINNDILLFIGYKVFLEQEKDTEGVQLMDEMDKKMFNENNKIDLDKITILLKEVPLYYLLSFLGYAQYKNSQLIKYDNSKYLKDKLLEVKEFEKMQKTKKLNLKTIKRTIKRTKSQTLKL